MQAVQLLIQNMKQLATDLQSSPHKGRDVEIAVCFVYLRVFETCLKKMRFNKHEKYIRDEFNMCDRKRLDFRDDNQDMDAFLEAIKQEAYRQVWEACDLPKGHLVKRKQREFLWPIEIPKKFTFREQTRACNP